MSSNPILNYYIQKNQKIRKNHSKRVVIQNDILDTSVVTKDDSKKTHESRSCDPWDIIENNLPLAPVFKENQRKVLDYLYYKSQRNVMALLRHFEVEHAVHGCSINTLKTGYVSVMKNSHEGYSFFKNLTRCNSIWVCPICCARVSERRRLQIYEYIRKFFECYEDGRVVLATYTLQHNQTESLKNVMARLKDAHVAFKEGRTWTLFVEKYGFVGDITGTEVTFGENGWHPHLHSATFFKSVKDKNRVVDKLKERWVNKVERQGGYASYDYGLDVNFGNFEYNKESVGDYMLKTWNITHEVSKSNRKRGAGENVADLVLNFREGDVTSGDRFMEYIETMKGVHMLHWGKGMKKMLKDIDKTDEEISEEETGQGEVVANLSWRGWARVIDMELRHELLASARDDKINEFIQRYELETISDEAVKKIDEIDMIRRERERLRKR